MTIYYYNREGLNRRKSLSNTSNNLLKNCKKEEWAVDCQKDREILTSRWEKERKKKNKHDVSSLCLSIYERNIFKIVKPWNSTGFRDKIAFFMHIFSIVLADNYRNHDHWWLFRIYAADSSSLNPTGSSAYLVQYSDLTWLLYF